jgi:hypothetical protein
MITALPLGLRNAAKIYARLYAMTDGTKRGPVVRRIGAGKPQRDHVIKLDILEGLIATEATTVLCLQNPLLQPA